MTKSPTIATGSTQPSARAAPRAPLPPHRLAKIANALGVSMPIPASQPNSNLARSSSITRSSSPSLPSEYSRRPPTPGAGSTHSASSRYSSTSKFLLHVIPPLHLPHESDEPENPDPLISLPNTSGYHLHFRRGTLVPVCPTLQSQLSAIAKEYGLPSTNGLILYLVSSGSPSTSSSVSEGLPRMEHPGPRLSEDAWKHIWARVVKAERQDSAFSTPHLIGLGMSIQTQSSTSLPQDAHIPPSPRIPPGLTPSGDPPPPTSHTSSPALSSPSSTSDLLSHDKPVPSSSSSVSLPDPDTPNTSPLSLNSESKPSLQSDDLDLPGLHSNAFIPVLAKVEFDVDRRKASWYEPWVRSRRIHHERFPENRADRMRSPSRESQREEEKEKPPHYLSLVEKMIQDDLNFPEASRKPSESPAVQTVPVSDDIIRISSEVTDSEADASEDTSHPSGSLGYEPLPDESGDSPSEGDDESEKLRELIEETELLTGPLASIFGKDADDWVARAEVTTPRQASGDGEQIGDMVVPAEPPETDAREQAVQDDAQAVQELLMRMSPTHASPMLDAAASTAKRRASRWMSGNIRRRVPPPLDLQSTKDKSPEREPNKNPSSAATDSLPYLSGDKSSGRDEALPSPNVASPKATRPAVRSTSRDGGFFDDLDLGLDHLGGDEMDNQVRMKTKLDELEKALALYSPQQLQEPRNTQGSHIRTFSSPSTPLLQPEPSASHLPRSRSSDMLRETHASLPQDAKWPSVPFKAIPPSATLPRHRPHTSSGSVSRPTLPQLVVNGANAPKHFRPKFAGGSGSIETETRKREFDGTEGDYLDLIAPSVPRAPKSSASPIIPLSPDPFGRFSSTPTQEPSRPSPLHRESATARARLSALGEDAADNRSSVTSLSGVTSSRFSVDSSEEIPGKGLKGASLAGVMNLKKLWRKSSKSSIDVTGHPSPVSTPTPPRSTTPTHVSSSQKMSRMSLPTTRVLPFAPVAESSNGIRSPQPVRPANILPPMPIRRTDVQTERFHFDQESPYPVYSPTPRASPAPPTPIPPPVTPTIAHAAPSPSQQQPHAGPPQDKTVVPKPILKWKGSMNSLRTSSISGVGSGSPSAVSSVLEKRASGETRARRPSIAALSAILGTSGAEARYPPNPSVPGQHVRPARQQPPPPPPVEMRHRASGSGGMRRQSVASERSSQASFDASQFEIVSPKMVNGVVLPVYTGVGF